MEECVKLRTSPNEINLNLKPKIQFKIFSEAIDPIYLSNSLLLHDFHG